MEATAQSAIYPNSSEKGSFFKRPSTTPRSSTRSSIRASPAAFLSLKRKGNRYDQLESEFDNLEINENYTKSERDHESESSSDTKEISDVENVTKNTSQYMTLINENHSDDNICSFENEVFVPPNESVPVKKRTPPPIPKRRSSTALADSANSSSENGRFSRPSKQSSIDASFTTLGEALKSVPPSTNHQSSNSHRDSPLPAPLPAPPSVKRNNSRKDRKRPAYVDSFVRNSLTSSVNSNNSKSFTGGAGGSTLGDRIFPCGDSEIKESRRTISSSPSSDCTQLNPFLPANRNSLVSSTTFSSITAPPTNSANQSQYSGPSIFDSTISSRQISSSVSQPDYNSIIHPPINSTWSCCGISTLQKQS